MFIDTLFFFFFLRFYLFERELMHLTRVGGWVEGEQETDSPGPQGAGSPHAGL